jgi:hypothetical protein
MVTEEIALPAVALGDAVDSAPPHFQDARAAVHVLALGRGEERGVEVRSERVVLDPDMRLDR